MSTRNSHIDRILGRVDDLDEANLAALVQRLVRERGLLTTIINTIREGVLVVNARAVIEYANDAALPLIGLREEDIGKAILWKFMPDLTRTLGMKPGELGGLNATLTRELELTYPERRHVRFYMTPFETERDGARERLFAVLLSDITEEKLSTEETIENEKVSSIMMLAAGVAHELGNPLNSINIHLQVMRRQLSRLEDESVGGKLMDAVEVCRSEVERLDGIIKHFLEAIRPSTPDLNELSLVTLLEEVLAFLAEELGNQGIVPELILGNKLPMVMADRNQIKQVFFNVCKNAMEAMEPGGSLKISTAIDDEFAYVYFADTGVGIDEEAMARLFQPYFSTKRGGHGLGMMVCERIMRDHGGRIGVDSRKGSGTVVTLQFPLARRRMRMLEAGE